MIHPAFDYCLRFQDGIAAVQRNRTYGYMDRTGKYAVSPRFDLAYNFSEGLAAGLTRQTYQWVFIGRDGREVLRAPESTTHVGSFSGGLAMAKLGRILRMNDGELYPGGLQHGLGYIDREGRWAIPPQFEWGGSFVDGRAWVQVKDRKYAFISPDGSMIRTPLFDAVADFRQGLAAVWRNGRFSLIDQQGKTFWSEN